MARPILLFGAQLLVACSRAEGWRRSTMMFDLTDEGHAKH